MGGYEDTGKTEPFADFTVGTPTVSAVNAPSATVGTTVTVAGSGFVPGDTTVRFGTQPGSSVDVLAVDELTVTVPAKAIGTDDVTVSTPTGTSPTSQSDRFTYVPIVAATGDPATGGYWLVSAAGNVYNSNAPFHGSTAGKTLPANIVGVAEDLTTGGYWLTTAKGNVYNFDAPFYGSAASKTLPAPVVAITATATGYLLTTAKGNVYNYNTPWQGSAATQKLPAPVVGAAYDQRTGGYWLTTAKGNVYNYDAPFHGSTADKALPAAIGGIAEDPATGGYWLTTAKGNVYNYDAPFYGSTAHTSLLAPVVAVTSIGAGYLITSAARNTFTYHTTMDRSLAASAS